MLDATAGLTRGAERVLLALGLHVDANSNAFPSWSTIAERAHLTRESVGRAVRELREAGLIEVVKAGGGSQSAVYRVRLVGRFDSLLPVAQALPPPPSACATGSAGATTPRSACATTPVAPALPKREPWNETPLNNEIPEQRVCSQSSAPPSQPKPSPSDTRAADQKQKQAISPKPLARFRNLVAKWATTERKIIDAAAGKIIVDRLKPVSDQLDAYRRPDGRALTHAECCRLLELSVERQIAEQKDFRSPAYAAASIADNVEAWLRDPDAIEDRLATRPAARTVVATLPDRPRRASRILQTNEHIELPFAE